MSSSATVVVLITGGGGFLGQCLASHLLQLGTLQAEEDNADGTTTQKTATIVRIILSDIYFPETFHSSLLQYEIEQGRVVKTIQGDISDPAYVQQLYDTATTSASDSHLSVFHFGAVMSGDGERDFDLCMRVNLHGTMQMLEGARKVGVQTGKIPKFAVTSAGATMGGDDPSQEVSDSTRATPHTTYGMTKACGELLVSDYGRRNLVKSRAIRLPTIVVRAGKPNAATTSCYSSVIREPLAGVDVSLPIAGHVKHAVTSTRSVMAAMVILHDASTKTIEQVLGYDRTIFLPAVALSLNDLYTALNNVVKDDDRSLLGRIDYDDVDERLSEIVGSFPIKVNASRALQLGIPEAPTAEQLIREYAEDFPQALVPGLELKKVEEVTIPTQPHRSKLPVAVITGAGSGIGRAVALRLARDNKWHVVLAGRRKEPLQQTYEMTSCEPTEYRDQHLVIPTDVTNEAQVQQLFERAFHQFGRIDVLFNNAGINCAPNVNVPDVPSLDFQRVLETNVMGPFLCAKYAMKYMKEGGRIINNGSISAHAPRPGSAPYTCSKHAILGLTKCLALDGRQYNVACGQVDFGNVVSEMSLATNKSDSGALQPNGFKMVEPCMTLEDAAETVWTMVNLPLSANVLNMTVMATQMPFVGRG